jgi:superfamily II DNA/RNA helicase
MSTHTHSPSASAQWDVAGIRALVEQSFHKRPCLFQIKIAMSIYNGKDAVAVAPTGAGKTLSFWIPLLMWKAEGKKKVAIFITPLNLLGQQCENDLIASGALTAISLTQENYDRQKFKVRFTLSHSGSVANLIIGDSSREVRRCDDWSRAAQEDPMQRPLVRCQVHRQAWVLHR